MKQAQLIPFEQKKDAQLRQSALMTPQQRMEWLFEAMDFFWELKKEKTYHIPQRKNSIILKRINNGENIS